MAPPVRVAGDALGTRYDRWLALEEAHAGKAIEITAAQAAFLEKQTPCFRERHVESGTPGELLSADTLFVGTLKGIGKVYLHAVVDTFGSYAFGFPARLQAARCPIETVMSFVTQES